MQSEAQIDQAGGPIEVDRIQANTFNVMASPTEISILCLSQAFGLNKDGALELGSVPVAQLAFSPAVAKELVTLLQEVIGKHEIECGEIVTPFLRGRKAE